MEFTMKGMALITAFFGIASFICGVIAENTKPASGTVIQGKDVVICKFNSDPMLYLGYVSFVFLILSSIAGFKSISYPYKKKSIPYSALFGTSTMSVFFSIAWISLGLASTLILWPTITEQIHHTQNVHKDLDYTCPTAKTGLIGGGAFVALSCSLFWLICLMLADNAREDYFEEIEEARKGERTQVINVEYDALSQVKV